MPTQSENSKQPNDDSRDRGIDEGTMPILADWYFEVMGEKIPDNFDAAWAALKSERFSIASEEFDEKLALKQAAEKQRNRRKYLAAKQRKVAKEQE